MNETERQTMNGKPVLTIPARAIINFKSGFEKKLLCSGPTFNLGSACAYSCSFCYVESQMRKTLFPILKEAGLQHEEVVIRKKDALLAMRSQLLTTKGKARFPDPKDNRVIYSSTSVDVAANMVLLQETVEACALILSLTNWHIRLLSKSNLLPILAKKLVEIGAYGDRGFAAREVRERMIFGVSTGTLDNALAGAFEEGAPLVSKRIQSIHRLQDEGFRTFGMICPSLPQRHYLMWAQEMAEALRIDLMEHVWAEVINVRGESMTNTTTALRNAGYDWEADAVERVSLDKLKWEEYAQETYIAHAKVIPIAKLRFLQYVTRANAEFWTPADRLARIARPGVVAL